MHFDRARSVYGTLSASLSQNGCSHNTLQQQSPDVHWFNPLWVLTMVEANQLHDTTPTSLPPLQPAQWLFKMWEIFMPHHVFAPAHAHGTIAGCRKQCKNIYFCVPAFLLKNNKNILLMWWCCACACTHTHKMAKRLGLYLGQQATISEISSAVLKIVSSCL